MNRHMVGGFFFFSPPCTDQNAGRGTKRLGAGEIFFGVGKVSDSFDGAVLELAGLPAGGGGVHLPPSRVTRKSGGPHLFWKGDSVSRD